MSIPLTLTFSVSKSQHIIKKLYLVKYDRKHLDSPERVQNVWQVHKRACLLHQDVLQWGLSIHLPISHNWLEHSPILNSGLIYKFQIK